MDASEEELKQPLVSSEEEHGHDQERRSLDGEEEEKQEKQDDFKKPNVHPYANVRYNHPDDGWSGHVRNDTNDSGDNPSTIDVVFGGLYTLSAALTVIQGFAMLIHYSLASVLLGLYTMAFGAVVVMFDLKSIVYGVSIEAYFPFLGNYLGRAATILFFAVLCCQTYPYAGWTKFIVLYNVLVATLQAFVYFTTRTVSSAPMEDLPDL